MFDVEIGCQSGEPLGVFGISADNAFAKRMRTDYNAAVFYISGKDNSNDAMLKKLQKYKKIIIGFDNKSF